MKRLSTTTLTLVLALGTLPMLATAGGDHGAHTDTKASVTQGSTASASNTDTVSTSSTASTSGTLPSTSSASTSSATGTNMVDGEVRKIDKEQGKVTIKHAELTNLDMPAMTMVFQVKDKSMLEQIKAGDKISFVADKIEGKFTVTQMEVKK